MEMFGQVCDEAGFLLGQVTFLFPFVWKSSELLVCWVATSKQQEEHGFWKWLDSSRSFLGFFTEFGDGVSSEGDTSHGMELWSIVEHNWKSSHTEYSIIDFDLSDDFFSMLFSERGEF